MSLYGGSELALLPNQPSLRISNLEGGMDDDKNLIEKIETVKHIAQVATDAAKHAMEPPAPLKPGDKVVIMPMVTDGMMGDTMMSSFVVIPKKAAQKKKTPDMSGRITPTYDFPTPTSKMPVKKAAKKAAKPKTKSKTVAKKQTAKKFSKKSIAKKWKSPAKAAKKKTGKKAVKKKNAKKSTRR
jgi:hypothetical protein